MADQGQKSERKGAPPGAGTHDPRATAEQVVAGRTADTDETEATHYTKQFVVLPRGADVPSDDQDEANKSAVITSMINAGLRPKPTGKDDKSAEPKLADKSDHPDGESVILTYTCEAVPADEAQR